MERKIVGTAVTCIVCQKRKAPRGRSIPMAICGELCDWDCDGYPRDPQVGSLWPGETGEDFGYAVRPFGSDVEVEA